MQSHSHLSFLQHGESSNKQSGSEVKGRSLHTKHIDVVDYLQSLHPDEKASFQDILQKCLVDLEGEDYAVLDMMKNNPKIDIEYVGGGGMLFKYRAKFDIRHRGELLRMVERVKSGISVKDIIDCYVGISADIKDIILSGEVMACKNSETRDTVLFPRGDTFLCPLSGTVSAVPGRQLVETSTDLRSEVRRGDAVRVSSSWFRIACAVSTSGNQPARASPPLSVSSVKSLSARNVYVDVFSDTVMPLDGDYDGTEPFKGTVYKHGCTNDIRDKWHGTVDDIKKLRSETDLHAALLKLNLISRVGTSATLKRFRTEETTKKNRKRANRRNQRITNTHLIGTKIAELVEKADTG
mmetsp:Transcript_22677/g.33142  ORF Transcript_22677/g.33142 Transcript_22677/m.33142 type:complete len:352 (+) Transcript_22677:58-1113(+)